ncbi:MAG: hypothetical protein ACXU8U_11545, partial [Asticcacaulis sp.]
ARPMRFAAPVTRAVWRPGSGSVNAAEIDHVEDTLNDQVEGKDGDGQHDALRKCDENLIAA